MTNKPNEYPFIAFNFAIEIEVEDVSKLVCGAAFAECDGLEMTMEVKTIREGGNNGTQIRLTGPTNYGQLTLKRGMTSSFDLWNWFSAMQQRPWLRSNATIVMLDADRSNDKENVHFVLRRCLPIKIKAPALNAKDGTIAVEEFQLAYESLTLEKPKGN